MSPDEVVAASHPRPGGGSEAAAHFELANHLAGGGHEVTLLSPAAPEETAELGRVRFTPRRFELDGLAGLLRRHDVAVAQGQHANDVALAGSGVPAAIDFYDPFLVEHLHYLESLGLDPYRNDHASWVLQLARGDYFLCSSPEQRLYYLGFLTAVGRVHPERVAADPELAGLIGVVPFGLDVELPAHRPLLPERRPGERRLLFGGLYDWYDPGTALAALALLPEEVSLLMVRNPNPDSTP